MSENSYWSQSLRSRNQLRQAVGLSLLTGNEKDNVGITFNALRVLKYECTRRAATTSSYSETIAANATAEQIDALLNALDALQGTAVWQDVLRAFKGFGDE